MELNKDSLEKALEKPTEPSVPRPGQPAEQNSEQVPTPKSPHMSQEEEVGFHKGALNTLVNERNELFKMIQNVEMVMQAHIKRLEELGVNIQTQQ